MNCKLRSNKNEVQLLHKWGNFDTRNILKGRFISISYWNSPTHWMSNRKEKSEILNMSTIYACVRSDFLRKRQGTRCPFYLVSRLHHFWKLSRAFNNPSQNVWPCFSTFSIKTVSIDIDLQFLYSFFWTQRITFWWSFHCFDLQAAQRIEQHHCFSVYFIKLIIFFFKKMVAKVSTNDIFYKLWRDSLFVNSIEMAQKYPSNVQH